jgi:hypothetical protein
MKKFQLNKYLIAGLMFFSNLSLSSQTIEKCYINMPERLNPVISPKSRMELLEYHKAGQSDSIQNRFGGQAYLEVFDTLNNRIVVKNTKNATFEMKLLKVENGMPVIGVIRSVCAPVCQSAVEFYDTAWNKMPFQFNMPKAIQWVNKDKLAASPNLDEVWMDNVLENSFVSLHFDAPGLRLVATNNRVEFLSDDDRKLISPLLNSQPIIYDLKGRAWIQKP